MKKIIINADDFGLTRKINEAVVKGYKDGVLTSATVMANGLAVEEAVEIANENPDLGVGIHLNLTVLKPTLPKEEVPSLTNSQGHLNKGIWKLPFRKINEVEKEWDGQICKLLALGLKPTHLDSHHHIYQYPPFTKVAIKLARKYAIPCLRLISPSSIELMNVGKLSKTFLKKSWRYGGNIHKPGTVIGIENYSIGKMEKLIDKLDPGIHEFFLHPGYSDDNELSGVSSLKEQRQKDLDLLINEEIKGILNKKSIELVNYRIFH